MSSKNFNNISFCIATNGKKVEKTRVLISSILGIKKYESFNIDINICGCTDSFVGISGVNLIDACQEAKSGMLSALRFIAAEDINTDIFVFVDDDFVFPEDWLLNLINFSEDNYWDVLGHKILLPNGDRFWDKSTFSPHRMINYDDPIGGNFYQTGGLWIIKSSVYNQCKWDASIPINATDKGFKYNEDVDMSIRIRDNGFIFNFDKNNLVWHNDDSYHQAGSIVLKTPSHMKLIKGTLNTFKKLVDTNKNI